MEYSGTSEEGHKIADRVAIGWLGNDRIHDPLLKEMCHNMTEFYCVEAEVHGYKHQFYDLNPAMLCYKAKEAGCSHVLILKVGIWPNMLLDKFTSWFENYYNGQVFTGHVLDKDDLYYEIHPQCMLVDVNWFCDNVKEFKQRFRNEKVEFVEPIRSEENFHGKYTPLWVKQGNEVRTYEGTCWGWNVVEAGLLTETGVGIWPEKIRQTYSYAYGEVKEDYIGKKAKFIGLLQNKETFFVANTEDFTLPEQPEEFDPDINRVIICTSGGLSAPFLAYNHFGKCTEGQKVVVVDRSGIALGMTATILKEFKPSEGSYEHWLKDYLSKYKWMRKLCQGAYRLKQISDYVDYHDAFKDYLENEFKDVMLDFEEIDLLNFDEFKMVTIKHLLNPAVENKDKKFVAYIHLSNVYHYYQSAIFHNIRERESVKTQIEEFLNDIKENYHNIELNIIGPGGKFHYSGYLPFSVEGARKAREIFPWTD